MADCAEGTRSNLAFSMMCSVSCFKLIGQLQDSAHPTDSRGSLEGLSYAVNLHIVWHAQMPPQKHTRLLILAVGSHVKVLSTQFSCESAGNGENVRRGTCSFGLPQAQLALGPPSLVSSYSRLSCDSPSRSSASRSSAACPSAWCPTSRTRASPPSPVTAADWSTSR